MIKDIQNLGSDLPSAMGASLNMMLPNGLGGTNSGGNNGNACGCK